MLIPLYIFYGIIQLDVTQIEGILKEPVGSRPACPIGGIHQGIPGIFGLAGHIPQSVHRGVFHPDLSSGQIPGGLKGLLHELLDIVRADPCGTQPDLDLRGIQVFGLDTDEAVHIDLVIRIPHCKLPGYGQLLPYISRKVLIRSHISAFYRILKDHAG